MLFVIAKNKEGEAMDNNRKLRFYLIKLMTIVVSSLIAKIFLKWGLKLFLLNASDISFKIFLCFVGLICLIISFDSCIILIAAIIMRYDKK